MTARFGHYKVSIINPSLSTGWDLLYRYTADLLCLEFHRPLTSHVPEMLSEVSTPLSVEAWSRALATHPDKAFARYICKGLHSGFRVGFQHGSPLQSASANMPSAQRHPEVIRDYLQSELAKGRMLGPFPSTQSLPPVHINRFGVIPKGHNSGKWRLITDLSFPQGRSVNDGIDEALSSLSYISVDHIAAKAAQLGPGALLAKVDIESAYRLVPVHPQDRPLLAVQWEGQIFIDTRLPFGLRSAAKIFNAIADTLQWHLHQAGIPLIDHYLDDFVIIGPPLSSQCTDSLAILDRECDTLGVPLAPHKREGPTTCLPVLGIVIDTAAGELRLPDDKLQRLQAQLLQWGDKAACTRKDLESLIGLLNHACKVVRSGRSFLRRMLDLLHAIPASQPFIRLNNSFRADLAWWRTFLSQWNGVSFLPPPSLLPEITLTTDASGSWGCGAWHGDHWLQLQWDDRALPLSIATKELIPIILACAAWGRAWQGRQVLCQCDNQVVVACLKSKTSKDKEIMHLLRCLVFVEATHQCFLHPTYIDTKANHLHHSCNILTNQIAA